MNIVKFADVAHRANTKEDRFATDKIYYVGGEHIDTNELVIHHKGIIKGSTIGPMFYCGFKSGQILFVTRNPHLRKCSIAYFDGICSEKTFVIESTDKRSLLQEYLALVMQSNDFWDYCEENKSGGVNYFVNWSTLAEYEFELPPLAVQKKLVEKVLSAYRLKESYKRLLTATQEIVKSRFIEMFGNQNTNDKQWKESLVKDVFQLSMGKTPARNNNDYWDNGTHKWVSVSDMSSYQHYTGDTSEYITDFAIKETGIKVVPKGTIIMSFKLSIGRTAITSEDIYTNEAIMAFSNFDESVFNKDFLYFLIANKNWLLNAKQAVKGFTLNKETIGNSKIIVPPLYLQEEFEAIYKQSDKSVFDDFKSRFIEMFGDPMDNSKGWPEHDTIGKFTKIILGSTPNSKVSSYWDGDIKWITPAEMKEESYYIYDTDRHITKEGAESANLTLMPCRTVLFSTRAPIGKVGLVGSPMYCNQGFKNFVCGDKLNPVYLYYSLIYKHDHLVSLGTGTTFKELSKKVVESLKIAIPPIDLQNQFEAIYKQSDKSVQVKQIKNTTTIK